MPTGTENLAVSESPVSRTAERRAEKGTREFPVDLDLSSRSLFIQNVVFVLSIN